MNKSGYNVWAYGEKSWHRTIKGAEKKAKTAANYCNDVQIIEVATGKKVN
jgi:hypothetical protein